MFIKLLLLLFVSTSCYCQYEFGDRVRNFSIELLHYTQLETEGHVVISPFGIWTLMTGLALGATGQSYEQIQRAFILPKNTKIVVEGYKNLTKAVLDPTISGVSLTSKNFMFIDNNFNIKTNFRNSITKDFDAAVKELNFKDPEAAAKIANSYIQNSGAKVSNVLRSDDFAQSRMILTNTISFEGLWSSPFNKSDTKLEPFYDENRKTIGEVNMMYQKAALPFSNIKDLKAFVLELPYGNDGKYSMLIALPHYKVKVADMYLNLAKVSLRDIIKHLEEDTEKFDLVDIDVKIPRFKISTNLILNIPLNHMGVIDIFDPDLASFGQVTDENIFVSAIIQKADIEVTESGTVASASTVATLSDKITTPSFEANKPFVYFVIEKSTTTVIFSGIYCKPSVF